MKDHPVLQRLSLSQRHLLGFGGESRVYALDDERVLQVYERGADHSCIDRVRELYESLGHDALPFEASVVLEVATHDDLLHAIEKRIHGERMTHFMKTAGGAARNGFVGELRRYRRGNSGNPARCGGVRRAAFAGPTVPAVMPDYPAARLGDALRVSEAEFRADFPG